jgi:carbon starvation protein CstA
MVQKVLDWLKKLLSNSDEVSTKRVVTMMCLLLIVAMVVSHICGAKIDPQILWPIITLCGSTIGLTVTSDIFKPPQAR